MDGSDCFVSHHWFPDTGASNHATPDSLVMSSVADYNGSNTLHMGNGSGLTITSIGSPSVATPSHIFQLSNLLHVLGLFASLLSVQRFAKDNNVSFEFSLIVLL